MHTTNTTKATQNQLPILFVSLLFFLSGAAGLIYQTVWVRLLELYFGVTLTAATLIVGAYMAGLGLGALAGGRLASKSTNTILLYGVIEAAIGIFGIFSPSLINGIGQVTAGSPYPVVFLLSFLLLLLPTVLMGMTLPLLTQAFVTRVETSGRVIGLLYGINTLGAAVGALISGYILMGWFGFYGALLAAAGLNFIVGAGAFFFKQRLWLSAASTVAGHPSAPRVLWRYEHILLSAFLVGFIGMGFEMLWFRVLGVINKQTAYGFPSILFIYLLALALGGWFWGGRIDRAKDPLSWFWKLEIGVGILTSASFLAIWLALDLPQIQSWLQLYFFQPQLPQSPYMKAADELVFSSKAFLVGMQVYFLPILVLVFPAGFLMGGGLPALDRIAIDQVSQSGRRVGDIHLANILGSVAGTLSTSFVLLPWLGSELTLKLLASLSVCFLLIYLASTRRRVGLETGILPLLLVALILSLPGRGGFYTRLYQNATGLKDVALRESGDGILALTFRGEKSDPAQLWIAGVMNSFFPSNGNYEFSALTCASAVQPKRVLMIGIGGGNSANFLADLPGVQEVVVVELMKELGSFLNQYVPVAQSLLERSNVRYVVDDGRRYLYANPAEKFDLIFIDPLWSFTAGHNNLYSREAMQLYQSHLQPGGIFCAWVNEYHLIPKTAASVFPYSDLFDGFMVNSSQALEYDAGYMQRAYNKYKESGAAYLDPAAYASLAPGASVPAVRRDHAKILQMGKNLPLLTDLTPWLEYYYACAPRFIKRLPARDLKFCYSD